MALILQGILEATRIEDQALDNSLETLDAASMIAYSMEINNADNNVDVYAKFYNKNSAVTVGTTDPEMIIKVDAGVTRKLAFTRGTVSSSVVTPAAGILFDVASAGVKAACVTDAGTGGTTSPARAVKLNVNAD